MSSTAPSGRSLVLTYIALMVLAGLSWLLSVAGTGTAVAILIASVKALLIALFFMELRWAPAVDRTIAAIAVLFVVLLCVGVFSDVAFR